jgi:hypothetical protein
MAAVTLIAVSRALPWQLPADAAAPCIRNSPASTAHTTARAARDIAAGRAAPERGTGDPRCRMDGT